MLVTCQKCDKQFNLDDSLIKKDGSKVRCSKCKNVFTVYPLEEENKTEIPITVPVPDIISLAYVTKQDEFIIVKLPWDTLDANNCNKFKDDMNPLLKKYQKFIFDLSQVAFIDSSGCGALNHCMKEVQTHDGDIKLCNISDQVNAIFRLIKLNRIFDIFDTPENAMQALKTK